MMELVLTMALMGQCSEVCAQPVKRVIQYAQPVKRVVQHSKQQIRPAVKKQAVVKHSGSNFVDPYFVQQQQHSYGGHSYGDVLYLAGQNLQTELIVKEAVREAVREGVASGVSSGVSEAMRLLREELLRANDPTTPDVFTEPVAEATVQPWFPAVTITETCVKCHQERSEGPRYNGSVTPVQAIAAMEAIKEGRMPKGGSLTREEKQALYDEFLEKI